MNAEKSSVNLQDGVWVAVRPTPRWRTLAMRANRSVRDRLNAPVPRNVTADIFRKLHPINVDAGSVLLQWEHGSMSPLRRALAETWTVCKRPVRIGVLVGIAFLVGFKAASGPDTVLQTMELRDRLADTEGSLKAREGELELVRLEMARMNSVMENSRKYKIPANEAAEIYDIALAEGIDPAVAFNLVNVESQFKHNAVSPVGAVGLAQLMPSTAFEMDPSLKHSDLFERKTNLRLGFRYLRDLIRQYHGNLRYALLAYNRGPATVDKIRREGGDPENGYSRAVLGK